MTGEALAALLRSRRFACGTEVRLQEAIASALTEAGVAFEREKSLSAHDRPDFLVGDVAIEVKIAGSLNEVSRQLLRYAQHEAVASIVLVTSRSQLARVPYILNGKQVHVAIQWSGL